MCPTAPESQADIPSALEIKSLSVFRGRTKAVDQVSLEVRQGSLFALLGRNGAGKSSLVRCLLGQHPAKSGHARVLGLDPWRERKELMRRIGFVPERPNLPRGISLRRVAKLCASLDDGFSLERFEDRLDRHGIDPRSRIERLSRGQQTLAQFAVALASSPELLVLDDPTLGLDAIARRQVLIDLVDDLADGEITVFFTTHDLAAVESLATDVGFLHDGQLVLCEEIDVLRRRLRRVTVADGTRREQTRGEVLRRRRTPLGEELIVSGAGAEGQPMSLEEIFVALAEPPQADNDRSDQSLAIA